MKIQDKVTNIKDKQSKSNMYSQVSEENQSKEIEQTVNSIKNSLKYKKIQDCTLKVHTT